MRVTKETAGRSSQRLAAWVVTVMLCGAVYAGAAEKDMAAMQASVEIYNKAAKELQAGKLDSAEKLLKQAIKMNPGLQQGHNTLGTIQLRGGRLDEAEASFRKALQLDSKYALAHNNLGATLVRKGQLKEAVQCFEDAVRLDPKDDRGLYNIGRILEANGHLPLATRYYLRAVQANNGNTDALWQVAGIYRRASQAKEAEIIYRQLVKATNYGPKAVAELAQLYMSQDMLASAAALLDEAKKAGAEGTSIDLERGRFMLLGGACGPAEKVYRELIAADPKLAKAHSGLAASIIGQREGDKRQALMHAQKGVDLSGGKDAQALYTLGLVKMAMNDSVGAQMEFLLAAKQDPAHVETQINLGAISAEAKQYDKAIEYFSRANMLAPDRLDVKYNLALARIQGNLEYEKGVRLLGDVAMQAPSGNKAAVAAAELLKKIADRARSMQK